MKIEPSSPSGQSPLDVRAEKIRDDIARRLRPICSNMTDEEFSALIEQMMNVQLRGERRAH